MANKQYKLTLSLSNGETIDAGIILVPQGDRGETGSKGATFTPSVSEAGVLSWTNNGGLTNPTPVNIKGPKGDDAVITSADVAGWGFTKNAGTITGIKMNGVSKGTSGVVDLGTVLTSHQDISGKANLSGGNTFTGKQTLNSPASDGYSINAAGYIKGSWLQASATSNKGANTGKVCVFDNAGWIYYRTPAEILTEAGGAKTSDIQKMYGHVGYIVQDDQAQECDAEIQVVWYSSNMDATWDELTNIVSNTSSYYPASGYIATQSGVRGVVVGIGTLIENEDMVFHYVDVVTGQKGVYNTQAGVTLDEIMNI